MAKVAACLLFGVMTTCTGAIAHAQLSRFNLRESGAVGMVTSSDQIKFLHFDKPLVTGSVQLGYAVRPWFELHASTQVARFAASKMGRGDLLDLTLGTLLRVEKRGLSPYLTADLGVGLTGALFRPFFSFGVGFDTPIKGRYRIGPVVGYGQLVQWNGPFQTTDARFLWFGISLRQQLGWTPTPPAPPPPPRPVEVARPEPPAPSEPSVDVLALIERALPNTTQRVELLAPVLFKFDSDALDPTGVAMLHEVAHTLSARADIKRVAIAGFADARGDAEYNRALSERRAQRVKTWLVEHGIAPERLEVDGRGASELIEPGSDETSHEQNRRVIFRIVEQEPGP